MVEEMLLISCSPFMNRSEKDQVQPQGNNYSEIHMY